MFDHFVGLALKRLNSEKVKKLEDERPSTFIELHDLLNTPNLFHCNWFTWSPKKQETKTKVTVNTLPNELVNSNKKNTN